MRLRLTILIFGIPLLSYADTYEIPLDEVPEEPVTIPVKRTIRPQISLLITDGIEIKTEGIEDSVPTTLKVWDSFGCMIFDQTAYGTYILPAPLQEGEVYSISLYVDNLLYTATYNP